MTMDEWVTIGLIRKPHGVYGYVKVELLTDVPDRFRDLQWIWLEFPDGRRGHMAIEEYHMNHRDTLLKLDSIDDLETAARLRGAYIQVRSTEKAPLSEGQFYTSELVGSRVITEGGDEIGHVREVLSMPANDIYVVDTPRGEVLIPAISDVVTGIDSEHRRVVIRLIPGLIP